MRLPKLFSWDSDHCLFRGLTSDVSWWFVLSYVCFHLTLVPRPCPPYHSPLPPQWFLFPRSGLWLTPCCSASLLFFACPVLFPFLFFMASLERLSLLLPGSDTQWLLFPPLSTHFLYQFRGILSLSICLLFFFRPYLSCQGHRKSQDPSNFHWTLFFMQHSLLLSPPPHLLPPHHALGHLETGAPFWQPFAPRFFLVYVERSSPTPRNPPPLQLLSPLFFP